MKLADALIALLRSYGIAAEKTKHRPAPMSDMPTYLASVVLTAYRDLGGLGEAPSLRPGAWDMTIEGVLVDLDEHLHFNRYRATTLQNGAYAQLPSFPLSDYRRHCQEG